MRDFIVIENIASVINVTLDNMNKSYSVTPITIEKNNTTKYGISIVCSELGYIRPNIYISEEQESMIFENIPAFIGYLDEVIEETKKYNISIDGINKTFILKNVKPCLVSGANKNFLKDKVYREVLDFAIYYRVSFDESSTGAVTNEMLKYYNITEEELYDASFKNISDTYNIIDMQELMQTDIGLSMYIVSNTDYFYGSSQMFNENAMKSIANEFNCKSFLIIPSSIHESICIDMDEEHAKEVLELVKLVNKTELSEEEILTNSVYKYTLDEGISKVA